jgi:hypothetical protein
MPHIDFGSKSTIRFILRLIFIGTAVLAGCAAPAATTAPVDVPSPSPAPDPSKDAASKLHWFGIYASMLYAGSEKIYFDPVLLSGDPPPADLIILTHPHGEAWSLPDVQQIVTPDTTIITNVTMESTLAGSSLPAPVIVLAEGQSADIRGVHVEGVRVVENPNHLGAEGITGFLVTVDGVRIYLSGESLYYPEMADLHPDIVLFSVFSEAGETDLEQAVLALQPDFFVFLRLPPSIAQTYVDRYNAKGLATQFIVPPTGPFLP